MMCVLSTTVFADFNHDANNPMQQKIFSQFKQLRLEGMESRISLEQNTLKCVQDSQNRMQMKACFDKSHIAMQNLKQKQQQQMESLKQTFQQSHEQNHQQ